MSKFLEQSVNPPLVDIQPLAKELKVFANERDWDKFHSPKNLVMALSGEVGELTEIFQWLSEDASRLAGKDPTTADKVKEELADVLMYLVRLADVLDIDLNDAATLKLQLNAEKSPIEKARGSSKKYTEL